ncbi:Uncharacterized iron-regulated membrane protein [Daejeonella rubra]|uniref:Uncharacterized iron-regulated membrane protein n=1 Tax=Daejeonella rubra TaxID=990371 RepID=A0A1G9RSF6_9SPHI|nr:PepSY-associated TM helix domain-containing protein [Daejeonella rubra]SDM26146.1 Uncharacterized iron-regulated membrane protein [Daejeonella rubra]
MKKFLTWSGFRKFLNDVHLWVGLSSGLLVLLICLSGTIYVFNTEIREFSRPEMYHVSPSTNAKRLAAEKLIAMVSQETGGKVVSIKIPSDPERSYVLTVRKPEESRPGENKEAKSKGRAGETSKENSGKRSGEKAEKGGSEKPGPPARGIQYMVDPYTGQILGNSNEKTAITEFMQLMFSLHRWLLLDRIEEPLFGELPNRTLGSYISGTATILFTLGVITGMVIWFPRKIRSWKNGLKIKWDGNWKRVNHDLHNSLGFYSCILLFLMGITGPQWSFSWYREGLRKTLGTYQPEGAPKPETPHSIIQGTGSAKTLFIGDFISAANKTLNYHGDLTIALAADSAEAIVVNKVKTGFFAPVASDKIYLDQYTASVLQSDIFSAKPLNERISASIKALHVGDVYGSFSKILYFLACLIATSLPVTGTLIWLNKMKKG